MRLTAFKAYFVNTLLLFSLPLFGAISFDDMMSREEMQRTGVEELNYTQKKALERWIDQNFVLRDEEDEPSSNEELYLSMNIEGGSKLQLSDGSIYEINPEDQIYTVYWITPIPFRLSPGKNPDYPVKITNMQTGLSINGKLISTKQFLKEAREKQALEEATQTPQPQVQPLPQPQVKPQPQTPIQPYQEPPRQKPPQEPISK